MSKLYIDDRGRRYWTNLQHELHREHGPAIELPNGHKFHFENGRLYTPNNNAKGSKHEKYVLHPMLKMVVQYSTLFNREPLPITFL